MSLSVFFAILGDLSVITGYLMIAKQFAFAMQKFGGIGALRWGTAAMAAALLIGIFILCALCGYATHMMLTAQHGHVANHIHVWISYPLAVITWAFVLMKQVVILADALGPDTDPLYHLPRSE